MSLTARPPRCISRTKLVAGDYQAGSLGNLQPGTSDRHLDHFKCYPHRCKEHTWLLGTENAVCSRCGLTVPKNEIPA